MTRGDNVRVTASEESLEHRVNNARSPWIQLHGPTRILEGMSYLITSVASRSPPLIKVHGLKRWKAIENRPAHAGER